MALFKILNNFNTNNSITSLTTHNQGYCYFDVNTSKFYIDTSDSANGLRQLNGTYYAECSTDPAIAAKTITVPGLSLVAGITVFIKFLEANTAAAPTLSVNGGTAYRIYQYDSVAEMSDPNTGGWKVNSIVPLTFDGTAWYKVFGYNSDATYNNALLGQGYGVCNTMTNVYEKAVAIANYSLETGGIVVVKFNNAVPENASLNISTQGAKAIYHRGAAITANVIKAGDTAYFIYDGTQY